MSVEIDIACPDRTFMGYLAMPAKKVGAGIILLHEGYGVTSYMRSVADKLSARLDMFVLVPDLTWRIQPCIELKETSPEHTDQVSSILSRLNMDHLMQDIQATITALREVGGCTGRIGVLGYGMGGVPAYLSAVKTDSDATVAYDAIDLQPYLDQAIKIINPLMLHIPVNPDNTAYFPQISSSLEDYMMVTFHQYEDTSASFVRPSSPVHHQDSAAAADRRTIEFLAANLAF